MSVRFPLTSGEACNCPDGEAPGGYYGKLYLVGAPGDAWVHQVPFGPERPKMDNLPAVVRLARSLAREAIEGSLEQWRAVGLTVLRVCGNKKHGLTELDDIAVGRVASVALGRAVEVVPIDRLPRHTVVAPTDADGVGVVGLSGAGPDVVTVEMPVASNEILRKPVEHVAVVSTLPFDSIGRPAAYVMLHGTSPDALVESVVPFDDRG